MPRKTALAKNVPKGKPQSNPSITQRAEGLWVDYELLRKHQGRRPEIVLHAPTSAANNRYLELADLALNQGKKKKKSKSATAE